MVQNAKKLWWSRFISQEPYIIWLSFMVHICKMIISLDLFIHFLILWVHRGAGGSGGKRAKTVQNNKKFCLLCSISREPYIIWLSFIVQMCKMIISPGGFLQFSNFYFPGCKGAERAKMAQNDKNSCLLHLIIQEPYIIWSSFMVYMYVSKDNISRHFFHFFVLKILIFGIIREGGGRVLKGQKIT